MDRLSSAQYAAGLDLQQHEIELGVMFHGVENHMLPRAHPYLNFGVFKELINSLVLEIGQLFQRKRPPIR